MALPPSPAAAICRESASPHPPRSPEISRPRRSDHHTGHSSQGPGRAQPNPGPLARLLLFPLFLPPPSPIRIVCLNSTLTNMDSSSLGRAVITAPPHREPDSPPPPISTEFNAAPSWRGGGWTREWRVQCAFPSTSRSPPRPRAPGTRSLPRKGPSLVQRGPSPATAGRRVNTGARPGAAPWGRGGRGGAPPPARRPARPPALLPVIELVLGARQRVNHEMDGRHGASFSSSS